MTKPQWVYTSCGMWSGRKDSVKRHVTREQHGMIVSYIDYLAGRSSGLYPPSAPPTYRSKTMTNNPLMDEISRAAARELVQQAFDPHSLINQPDGNAVGRQQGPRPPPYSTFWTDIDGIFGLGAYICTKCLAIKPFKICCRKNEKGSKKEWVTGCDPLWLNNAKAIDNVEEYLTGLRHDILSYMSQLVSAWTNNSNGKYLAAIQVPDPSNRSSFELTFNAKTGLKRRIDLPFAEDKCRDLEIPPPATVGQDRSHWAARAIRDRETAINDDELLDFLIKANNDTTFGFFKIKTEQAAATSSSKAYLMAITRSSQSYIDLVS
jgi:hypothetical protein